MNGLSEGIVGLWLLPVTLCILVPLAIFAFSTLVKVINRCIAFLENSMQPTDFQILKSSES